MSTYRHYTASDDDALALYRWNILAAGAACETLGLVEVAVRNAIDRELRLWNAAQPAWNGRTYNQQWLANPARPLYRLLNRKSRSGTVESTYQSALARARKDIKLRPAGHPHHGKSITHDDLVAHTMFGTWANLLPNPLHAPAANPNAHGRQIYAAQTVLWNQALHRAFPGQGNPTTVFVWVDRMISLRNRVAHAEPL